MAELDHQDLTRLVHDWNVAEGDWQPPKRIELDDESLRDGLQNPSVRDPELEDKKRILHLMNRLGVDTASLGLPGAGPKAYEHVKALCADNLDPCESR